MSNYRNSELQNIGSILKRIRLRQQRTLVEIAECFDDQLHASALSRIENAKDNSLTIKTLQKVCSAMGIKVSDVILEAESGVDLIKEDIARERRCPILTMTEALDLESIGKSQRDDWRMVPVPDRAGPRTFAVQAQGNSMISPTGPNSYPPGAILLVDPDKNTPDSGEMVIASTQGSDSATFKMLIKDGTRLYLTPLNQQYQAEPVSDITIIGTVIATCDEGFIGKRSRTLY